MTRIVELHDKKPLIIDPTKETEKISICRCGLSQNWPYCDSSHKATLSEEDGRTYRYERDENGELRRSGA